MIFFSLANLIFSASSAGGLLYFGLLARKWPDLMIQWKAVEAKFPKYRTKKEREQLKVDIRTVSISFMICASCEHILAIMTRIYYVRSCKPNADQVSAFFISNEIFRVTSYALWKGILDKFNNIVATIVWNYLNFFIVMVSVGISSRFRQLNREMDRIKGEVRNKSMIIIFNFIHRMKNTESRIYLISVLRKNIGKSDGHNIALYQIFAVKLMNRSVNLQ